MNRATLLYFTLGACCFPESGCSKPTTSGVALASIVAQEPESESEQNATQSVSLVSHQQTIATYANYFRVASPSQRKEAVLDFGVVITESQDVRSPLSIALNVYTTKRLLLALEMAIDRHEAAFGQISVLNVSQQKNYPKSGAFAYVNFVRVSSTPEELILGCGLNPQPFAKGQIEISPSHTIVMLHDTAKRLAGSLTESLRAYEEVNGAIELDVRKRVVQ